MVFIHLISVIIDLTKQLLIDILADSVRLMRNLTSLDLSDNPAGEGGIIKVFHELLCTKIHSITLTLLNMDLGVSDIQALYNQRQV